MGIWRFTAVALVLALPASGEPSKPAASGKSAAADAENGVSRDAGPASVAASGAVAIARRSHGLPALPPSFFAQRGPVALEEAMPRLPVHVGDRMGRTSIGSLVQDKLHAPVTPGGPPADARGGPSAPETAGDVMAIALNAGIPYLPARFNVLNGPTDYWAERFETSELARRLPPPDKGFVDALWMSTDSVCSWDSAWSLKVVLEGSSAASMFHPDLATPAATISQTTFDPRTLTPPFNQGSGTNCTNPVSLKVELPDAPYPASARLAIDDGVNDDKFARTADEPLSNFNPTTGALLVPWLECTLNTAAPGPGCRRLTTDQTILVKSGRVVAAAGTALGWRLPDFFNPHGQCANDIYDPTQGFGNCFRYLRDYVDDDLQTPVYQPDQDVRISVAYDVSGATARRAGVFVRGDRGFGGTNPNFYETISQYYAVVVERDAAMPTMAHFKLFTSDDVEASNYTAPLATSATTVPLAGTLIVDVTGALTKAVAPGPDDGVDIRAYLNTISPTPALSFRDTAPARNYRGDVSFGVNFSGLNFGNLFGVIFPGAGGGEVLDDFNVKRNADLFIVAQMPPNKSVNVWTEAEEGGREYINTFASVDGTNWGHIFGFVGGPGSDADCTRTINSMFALQVKQVNDPAVTGHILFQVNHDLAAITLPCGCSTTDPPSSTCSTKTYACIQTNDVIDTCYCNGDGGGCPGDRPPLQGSQWKYDVGQPIEVVPIFANDHSPDNVNAANAETIVIGWVACKLDASGRVLDPNCQAGGIADLLLDTCVNSDPGRNCGYMANSLGSDKLADVIGMNQSTVTDLGTDMRPEGPVFYYFRAQAFTPPSAGEYAIFAIELYDGFDATNGNLDPFETDEQLNNNFLRRRITVEGGCATSNPYTFDRYSLKMVKNGSADCPGQTKDDIAATWATQGSPGATAFDLHFIDGKTSLAGECGTSCNPWSDGTVSGASNQGTVRCIPNPAIGTGIGYFEVFQAANCPPPASASDCTLTGSVNGTTYSCTQGTECCSGTCTTLNVCQ